MIANVPTIDSGTARLGMIVADTLRRNRKMTITTSAIVSMRVNCTSCTDSRMAMDRSYTTLRFTAAGSCARDGGLDLVDPDASCGQHARSHLDAHGVLL